MRRRETVSNRYLQRVCGYWRRPDVPLREGESHQLRDDGDELHDLARADVNGDDDAVGGERALAMFEQLRPLLDKLKARAEKAGGEALAEVSYAFSPTTGRARMIGVGLSREARDALCEGDEYAGTADLVLLFPYPETESIAEIEVYDHKTTWVGGEPQDAVDQLVTYAAIAGRAHGADSALAIPISVHEESASFGVPTALADEIAIDAELDELTAELLEDVSKAEPNPGPWCSTRYCRARAACPATTQAIERVVAPEALVRPYVPGQGCASKEQVAKVRTLRKLLEEACAAMKADERAGLDKFGDVELADGSIYYVQRSETERAVLDVPGAIAVLEREGAAGAIKKSVTWSDVKKTIGKDGEAAVREGLRRIGAIKKTAIEKPTTKAAKGRAKKVTVSPISRFEALAREQLEAADQLKKENDDGE